MTIASPDQRPDEAALEFLRVRIRTGVAGAGSRMRGCLCVGSREWGRTPGAVPEPGGGDRQRVLARAAGGRWVAAPGPAPAGLAPTRSIGSPPRRSRSRRPGAGKASPSPKITTSASPSSTATAPSCWAPTMNSPTGCSSSLVPARQGLACQRRGCLPVSGAGGLRLPGVGSALANRRRLVGLIATTRSPSAESAPGSNVWVGTLVMAMGDWGTSADVCRRWWCTRLEECRIDPIGGPDRAVWFRGSGRVGRPELHRVELFERISRGRRLEDAPRPRRSRPPLPHRAGGTAEP